MPYTGTAKNTHSASAAVVDSDAVGGTYPGTIPSTLATAMKMNSVPTSGR